VGRSYPDRDQNLRVSAEVEISLKALLLNSTDFNLNFPNNLRVKKNRTLKDI
jgi:hypothetical protein